MKLSEIVNKKIILGSGCNKHLYQVMKINKTGINPVIIKNTTNGREWMLPINNNIVQKLLNS